ncbi:hypothetical protein M758_UG032100 [Ceratodon purpureus]|nr:hypothetical protein M758_UG032100 [Ceratodon purpureus]
MPTNLNSNTAKPPQTSIGNLKPLKHSTASKPRNSQSTTTTPSTHTNTLTHSTPVKNLITASPPGSVQCDLPPAAITRSRATAPRTKQSINLKTQTRYSPLIEKNHNSNRVRKRNKARSTSMDY